MKHNYQHIFKKTYAKPVIEEVMLDREMSLVMNTTTPPIEDPDPGEEGPLDAGYNPVKDSETYRSAQMPTSSPFGGSRPVY